MQILIALMVPPEGLPLAYEVLLGNAADSTTLRAFLAKIERQYDKAQRIWCMERGIPTEAVLEEMRAADPPVQHLVGTPKGPLNRLEQAIAAALEHGARGRQGQAGPRGRRVTVYVFAECVDRIAKERSMRKRQLK